MDARFAPLFHVLKEKDGGTWFLWSRQPVTDTSYMDLASTVYAVVLARKERLIDEHKRDEYLYDLLITPFLTVRDIHRAEQDETM